MKKIVQRTCIGCNSKKEKKDLLRIVLNKDEEIFFDETGKANGRGIYICNNPKCLENAIKGKKFEKAFKKSIDDEFYKKIRGVIIEKESET